MANNYTSPNMVLTIPVVGSEAGPAWANDINSSLTLIDAHDHSSGKGVQIGTPGINIASNLTFNTNSAVSLFSAQFTNNASALSSSYKNAIFSAGTMGDLYWNNGSGTNVQITSGSSVVGSAGTITGLPSGTASASFNAVSGTFIFDQATSTGANIDSGSLVLRYPGSYPSPSGNAVVLQAPSSISGVINITLPAAYPGSSNSFLVMSSSGAIAPYCTIDNSTLVVSGGVLEVPASGITSTQIAAGAVGSTQIASGGVASGNLSTNLNIPGSSTEIEGLYPIVSNASVSPRLQVVSGTFTSTGSILTGQGFTITSVGSAGYVIGFTNTFATTPVVVACPSTSAATFASTSNISTTSATIHPWGVSGSYSASAVTFISIG